jgi:hypothetical protein
MPVDHESNLLEFLSHPFPCHRRTSPSSSGLTRRSIPLSPGPSKRRARQSPIRKLPHAPSPELHHHGMDRRITAIAGPTMTAYGVAAPVRRWRGAGQPLAPPRFSPYRCARCRIPGAGA